MPKKLAIHEEVALRHLGEEDFVWSGSVEASETQGQNRPPRVLAHENIDLLVGGVLTTTEQTDANGIATFHDVAITSLAKSVVITARANIGNEIITARRALILPHPKAATKKPSDLELKSTGKDGNWTIFATIVAEDGTGVPGTIVVMRADGTIKQEATETDGTKEISLSVTDRQEEIRFLVAGTNIDKKLVLHGPPKTGKFFPRLTDADKTGSFWDAFKAGAKGK